jgi:YD repeat-containing protein
MTKRIVVAVLALVAIHFAACSPSNAQAANPCVVTQIMFADDPVQVGWWYFGVGEGPFSYFVGAWTCPPANAGNETCPTCPHAGKQISLATGNAFIEQADVRIPGVGGGLSLVRTWNGKWPASLATFQVGAFGANWRSTYEERIVMGFDNYLKYSRSDGSFWSFKVGGSSTSWTVAAPANVTATLSTDTSVNAYYTLTFQNGEKRRFDKTTGNLIAIIDRNGNTTTIAYDSSGRLSTVTDAASRQLTLSYGSTGNLVTSVSSSVGISLLYAYDSQGRLTQVTKPDSTILTFAYNSQSLITSVTDSNGKVLESHTYDSQARGLTSSRAGGVEAVTISYPNP